MVYSIEWWDFHLTPKGWIQGSLQLDIGSEQQVDVPGDAILTRRFAETMDGPFSPLKKTFVDLDIKDKKLAGELLRKYPLPWKYYHSFEMAKEKEVLGGEAATPAFCGSYEH